MKNIHASSVLHKRCLLFSMLLIKNTVVDITALSSSSHWCRQPLMSVWKFPEWNIRNTLNLPTAGFDAWCEIPGLGSCQLSLSSFW
jgi:hypothetical protein